MRRETFPTPGPVRLDLEIPAGRIEVETAKTEETHVELEAMSDNDAVREAVERSRIDVLRRGEGHEVIVEVPTQRGVFISFSRGPDIRFGAPEIRLRITCPDGADLDVRTKSADLDARGEYGTADVKTASGDVSVQASTGEARVKTASGDVHFERVDGRLDVHSASGDLHAGTVRGDAQVQLVSGDVSIGEAGGSVSANTVSGDQRIRAALEGRVELRAISGDISVGIPRGTRLFVDANTVSGSTSSEVELGDVPGGEAPAEGPLVEVFAKTVSGDVKIERAPARHISTELSERS
jgi:DUF4097 and DUF4098 domain-containing protein YvlB